MEVGGLIKFTSESNFENGQEIINYYIDGKSVDEKTFWTLREDEFCKTTDSLKWHNVRRNPVERNTTEVEQYDDVHIQYAKNLLEDILAANEDEAIEIIINELNFQAGQAYYQGQIDLNKIYSKMFRTNMRGAEDALQDLLEEYDMDGDEEEE
jgi:hypothetical protein